MNALPVSGNILPLSRAVGRRCDDIAVLSAMLVVGENPLRTESDDCVWWTFVNSGVEFLFAYGTLAEVELRLVYDRTGSFNGIVVPSWLVESWWCRPNAAQVHKTFGAPQRVHALFEDSTAGAEVFNLETTEIRTEYDVNGGLCSVSLTAA